jgi:glycosyltransferase involved in cell wall biosynthesis
MGTSGGTDQLCGAQMKSVRLLCLTEGRHVPSSRFRVEQLIPLFEKEGIECTLRPSVPNKYLISKKRWWWPYFEVITTIVRIWHLRDIARFDAIWLQRDLTRWSYAFPERLLFFSNCPFIFDIDDAQWLFSSRQKILEIGCRASQVWAGNDAICQFFAPQECLYVPTVVPVNRYPVRNHEQGHPIVIGWTGTRFNYSFFAGMRSVFSRLLASGKVELKIISEGGEIPELKGLPVRYQRWTSVDEIDALSDFDIGIMPLPDNELTRHKCGLKLVQYGAAGIPSVASPVGANRQIVRHGETGFLCNTAEEWEHALRILIEQDALRATMGIAARKHVAKYYSAEAWAPRLAALIKDLVDAKRA